jgi:2-haloalkanoic acid dehalogenase type II
MAEIKVVTFDADQTLVDWRSAMGESLRLSLETLSEIQPGMALTFDDLVSIREEVARLHDPGATMEAIRHATFQQALNQIGANPELAADLTEEYLENRYRLTRIYDDALPVLAKLKSKYQLGLATNGNSYPHRCGLDNIFDFTIIAQEHGVRKPDHEFYHLVARTAMRLAAEIVHVGDSLEEDVEAAQAIGIRGVWVNRDGANNPGTAVWAEIQSLEELTGLLAVD